MNYYKIFRFFTIFIMEEALAFVPTIVKYVGTEGNGIAANHQRSAADQEKLNNA